MPVADIPAVGLCTPETGTGTPLCRRTRPTHTTEAEAVFADDATVAGKTLGALHRHPCDGTARKHSIFATATRLGDHTAEVHGIPDRPPDRRPEVEEAVSQAARTLRRDHPESPRWR